MWPWFICTRTNGTVNHSCSHASRMVCMESFHTLPSQSQFSHFTYTQNPRCYGSLENYIPHKLGRLWCQPLMFTCLQNGRYATISHSNITITIFLPSSYTQIPRIINVTMIYLHPHKPGRLWCQPLMFASLQNGLYAIISHSTISITIFLHFTYTQMSWIAGKLYNNYFAVSEIIISNLRGI